jgi:RNA polymerase primary sigma factor
MDQLSTRKRPTPPTPDDARGEMHLYGRAMDRSALLDREEERALALEIEERAHALWTTLLSHPGSAGPAARLAAERLPSAAAILRPVEHAASEAARRVARARPALARAARAASPRLHALDLDHVVVDEIVAQPRTRGRHARAVAAAAAAVADARRRFVEANLGLVLHVAARYRSPALSYGDFVQEGMFGLIKAVDRFDHRRGARFSTYATWWIRHSMGRALADKSRLVRVPVHMQETRQHLGAIGRTLRSELGREPSNQELADAAGVDVDKLERIQQASQPGEVRLDELIGEDEGRPRGDIFVHPTAELDPEEALHRRGLSRLAEEQLQALSETERDVLRRRFGLGDVDEEATLREIGRDYGLSRERIRQIEDGALRKLRARLGALA